MNSKNIVSRRRFVGGVAAAAGYFGLRAGSPLWAQTAEGTHGTPVVVPSTAGNYDALDKLCFNENPYGPPESVVTAMAHALKYANRYGYPDGGLIQAIADHHGVKPENVVLGAGSTEVLQMVADAFLPDHKQVVGVEPTFGSVYEFATGLKASAIKVPLLPDHRQDIPGMIKAAQDNQKTVGFVYLCNPNNPTGAIVTRTEVKQLLDGIPANLPVLIDEAYHHFAEDADYATSIPYVLEGRPVIVTRTFSKIAALAGMRLGYGIAPATLIDQMRPFMGSMTINALVKWGAVAALKDTAAMEKARQDTIRVRKQTIAEITALGYSVIPSECNFFMINIRRQVRPVIKAFQERGILVGRPFPPMLEFLRVSVGTTPEMNRFMAAFKEILPAAK
ncbi:MAG: putative Histidinol-phosphate aminotransferase [Pedosphaera sp.]|nr:putative Histidinol-phosphate aminotransferase [Pedosphaera sp.]